MKARSESRTGEPKTSLRLHQWTGVPGLNDTQRQKKSKTRIGKQCCRTVLPRKVNAEQNEESQLQKPEKQMEQNTRGRRIWKTKRNSTACHKILQREMDRQTDSKSEAKLNLATHRSSTGTKKMGRKTNSKHNEDMSQESTN
jgi:hypothetical protein